MLNEYFYRISGSQVGPTSQTVVLRLMLEEKLRPGDQFWTQDGGWRDVAELMGSLQQFEMERDAASQTEHVNLWSNDERAHPLPDSRDAGKAGISNREMQRLFVECLDHQRPATESPNVPVRLMASYFQWILWCWTMTLDVIGFLPRLVTGLVQRSAASTSSVLSPAFEWKIARISLAVVLLGLGIGLFSPLMHRISAYFFTQDQTYDVLKDTFAKWKEFQGKEDNSLEWSAFQVRSLQKIAAIAPALESNASSDDPVSLSLLWIARDYLPVLLKERDGAFSKIENKIEVLLARIDSQLQHKTNNSVDWGFVVSLILDIVVVCFVALLAIRHWRSTSSAR